MTAKWKCNVGEKWTYQTRPLGSGTTWLLIQPYIENGVSDDTECTWHVELSNCTDNIVKIKKGSTETMKVNISAGTDAALVDVRNTGGWPFYCWTDY